MEGPDAERMIDEIESYLRTGEGPPAAPEPRRLVRLHRRPRPLPSMMPGRRQRMRLWLAARARTVSERVAGPERAWRRAGRRGYGGPPGGPGGPAGGPPRWTIARIAVVVVVLAALLAVPVFFAHHRAGARPNDHASAAPAGPGYAFLNLNPSGTPVRWDPCVPIHYRTYLAGAPTYAAGDIETAVEQVSAATGISFVDGGAASSFPFASGPAAEAPAGTRGPGPVVIAWADSSESSRLKPLPAGAGPDEYGRAEPVEMVDPGTGFGVYVTGTVVIQAAADKLPPGFGPGRVGAVLLHELGRLMGLGTVDNPAEIMNAKVATTKAGTYGPGDLSGLHRLGSASGCVKPPAGGSARVTP